MSARIMVSLAAAALAATLSGCGGSDEPIQADEASTVGTSWASCAQTPPGCPVMEGGKP